MITFTVRTLGPFVTKKGVIYCAQIVYAYRQYISRELRRHFYVHLAAINLL